MAELALIGDPATANLAPNGTIDTPLENLIINISDTLDFNGTASDFEANLPFTYLWNFGAGSGIADATIEDPGSVLFNNEGVFTVSFTVTDSLGQTDPTPASRIIEVCTPPSVSILEPENKHIQTSSTLTIQAHPCLDSSTHAGWGVRFRLINSDGITVDQADDTVTPYQATFTGLLKDEYTVQATLIDQFTVEVGGTTTQVSQIGIGDYYVAVGDSITLGLGDDLLSDNISQDGRNTTGGYPPILNDRLTTLKDYPHTVINNGIAGDTSIEGLLLMPSLLASNPEIQYFLIQYGTNDAGIPLPSGLNLSAGQSGYNGSFKDNMQQMITLVANAGKQAYLAKIPFAKGSFSGRNTLIQEYNQVIDQLISENSISVAAPDLYTFFELNQDQYSDDLHLNGTGYQSMADLWFNALTP
jgi:lysophospholipase L1-like esterase